VPPAPNGVHALQHDQAGTLAEQEPAPASIERAHVVPRQRAQHVEAPLDEAAEGVPSACQHDVSLIGAQEIGAQADAGGARRAGRRDGHGRPAGAQPPGQVARRAVVRRARHAAKRAPRPERAAGLVDPAESGADNREQKRLQGQIQTYQGRISLSPGVEEQYKQLTRDYDTAFKFYQDLLGKKSQSEMATDMERRQQGEQMHLLNAASLPESPSFPNRLLFAAGGLGSGLVIGMGLALWLELRDKSIRNEADVVASLQMPVLVSLPWVTEAAPKNGGSKFWNRDKTEAESDKAKVGV